MKLYGIRHKKSGELCSVMSANTLHGAGRNGTSIDNRYLEIDSSLQVGRHGRRTVFATHDLEFLGEVISQGAAEDFKYRVGFEGKASDFEAVDLATMEAVPTSAPEVSADRRAAWVVLPSTRNGDNASSNNRAAFREDGATLIAAIADGNDETKFGQAAAVAALASLTRSAPAATAAEYGVLLEQADRTVKRTLDGEGDTSLVLFSTEGRRVWGASAGLSSVVAYGAGRRNEREELTFGQSRTKLVGSGCAVTTFEREFDGPTILVAGSGGLWNCASREEIDRAVEYSPRSMPMLAARLEQIVRSTNKDILPEDLTIVCVLVGGETDGVGDDG